MTRKKINHLSSFALTEHVRALMCTFEDIKRLRTESKLLGQQQVPATVIEVLVAEVP